MLNECATGVAPDLLDTRVRMQLLTHDHAEHKLTMNLYLTGVGASEARVWCATCSRTLRARGRVSRTGDEVVVGIG